MYLRLSCEQSFVFFICFSNSCQFLFWQKTDGLHYFCYIHLVIFHEKIFISVTIPPSFCVRQKLCDVVNILAAKNKKKQGKKKNYHVVYINYKSAHFPFTYLISWSDSKRVGFSVSFEYQTKVCKGIIFAKLLVALKRAVLLVALREAVCL